jgi:hypothetical protein
MVRVEKRRLKIEQLETSGKRIVGIKMKYISSIPQRVVGELFHSVCSLRFRYYFFALSHSCLICRPRSFTYIAEEFSHPAQPKRRRNI